LGAKSLINRSVLRLIKMMKPYKGKVVLAAIFVILVNTAQLAKPYILKIVIDDFLINGKIESGLYSITSMGVLYMLVTAASSTLTIGQVNLMNRASQEILCSLRKGLFEHIQHLPLKTLDRFSSGRLITRVTNDVEALDEMFTEVLLNMFKDVFLLLGIIVVMLRMNIKLALISFSVIPFIFMITFYLKGRIKSNFKVMKALIGRINGFFAENISGMKVVQIFRREEEKRKEFEDLNDEYFNSTIFNVRMNSFLRPLIEIFETIAISLLIWYGMGKIAGHTLELGVLYAFTNYIKQFFEPVNDMAENYSTIQSAVVSAERIFELLDLNEDIEDLDSGMEVPAFRGEIEFKNVWFAYKDEKWILKDVSFKIKKGETAAFVGATGAGKTTIISLLSRFYKIQKGEILIDGININDISLRSLRRNIGVILQDVFLFSGDIKGNIALNTDISNEDIAKAIELSQADSFINEFSDGIDERVMERGSTFSAGQRQLLSFARAIAHNPSIMILDEATANIDTKTEMLIQKSIENISKNRTTIIIAHRLSTIRNADKIIVLKHGKIVEMGNHDELLKVEGYYRELYTAQFAS